MTEILWSELIGHPNDEAGTLLHVAAFGDSNIVRLLTSEGHDVNHQNDDGVIPLHMGTMVGNVETLRLLLSSCRMSKVKSQQI